MARMKRPNVVDGDQFLPEETSEVDIRSKYAAPFPIYNPIEGDLYVRLNSMSITAPRCIDWGLMETLGVRQKLEEMLGILGMDRYAKFRVTASRDLCVEFLSTLDIASNGFSFTCRFKGGTYIVKHAVLGALFGFHKDGSREVPVTFDAKQAWLELTGFQNWASGGMPNGFLKDPVVGILHKFIAYCISGNDQGNKVNKTELYLLHCAVKKVRVCASAFLLEALQSIQRRKRCHPALPQIAIIIAAHFNVVNLDFPHPSSDALEFKMIDLNELKGAQFAASPRLLVSQEKRQCVIKYLTTKHDDSSSYAHGEDTDEQPVADHVAETAEPGAAVEDSCSCGGYARVSEQLRAFQQDCNSKWEEFQRQVSQQFESQNERLTEQTVMIRANNQKLDLHNNRWADQNKKWMECNAQIQLQNQQIMKMQKDLNDFFNALNKGTTPRPPNE